MARKKITEGKSAHGPAQSSASRATRKTLIDKLKAEITKEISKEFTDDLKQEIADEINRKTAAASAKATKYAGTLERLATQLDATNVWTRDAATTRRPRLTRDDIAAAAIGIADTEGIAALSMRRLATELDVGTMSLYHYVRTKDELLSLVIDAMLNEVLIPPTTPMPQEWRAAITLVARRSRDALLRHRWVLDINDDPPIGPNAMRHFDQTLQAVSGFNAPLEVKLDLMAAVDEYVFGHCLFIRNNLLHDEANSHEMLQYMGELLAGGDYPTLQNMVDTTGLEELWRQIHSNAEDTDRFDRNLRRLLDGFEARLPKR